MTNGYSPGQQQQAVVRSEVRQTTKDQNLSSLVSEHVTNLLRSTEEVTTETPDILVPVAHCDWITQSRLCFCSQQVHNAFRSQRCRKQPARAATTAYGVDLKATQLLCFQLVAVRLIQKHGTAKAC